MVEIREDEEVVLPGRQEQSIELVLWRHLTARHDFMPALPSIDGDDEHGLSTLLASNNPAKKLETGLWSHLSSEVQCVVVSLLQLGPERPLLSRVVEVGAAACREERCE